MKKQLLLSLLAAPALLCADELPGQLPNPGFEDGWGACTPFVGGKNSDSNTNSNSQTIGETPANWTISQVIGISGTGKTQVGEKLTPGNNSSSAVKLYNSANSIMKTQIVPGYITLGTPWNTSQMGQNNDGGTFGGIQFDLHPDALQFDYTRTHGTAKPDEPFTVVAYAWNGQTSQKNVPANITAHTLIATNKITMYDRDRNILGIETTYGDAPTHTADFELVASINTPVTGDAAAWTTMTLPFNYASNNASSKLNVIFSAGGYFDQDGLGAGNTLCVDNVKLLYYSRLSDIKVNGNSLASFNPDKFEYYIEDASVMDTDGMVDFFNDFTGVKMGRASAVNMNGTGSTVKLTVTNPDGCDVDSLAKHVYSLSYGRFYDGLLDVELNNENIVDGEAKSIFICKEREGYARFVLPDFAIALTPGDTPIPLGDIVVPNLQMLHVAADAKTYYRGSVQGMSFLGGAIVADVNVEGYLSDAGEKNFKISVDWIMNPESGETMPIPVRFYSEGVDPAIDPVVPADLSGIVDINAAPSLSAPVYYNLQGIRVDNPQPGQIYIQRLGNNASKILK